MPDINKNLRRTLFGGFNSRDVVAYIDRLTEVHRTETVELRRELERTAAERDAALRKGGDADGIRSELETASAALAERTAELADASTERDALASELAEVRERLARYEEADMQLEQKLAELERVKARVTDIELEAHERACRIEQEAQSRADAAKCEASRLVAEARDKYAYARREAERAVGAGLVELDRMRDSMNGLMSGLDGVGSRLDDIRVDGE